MGQECISRADQGQHAAMFDRLVYTSCTALRADITCTSALRSERPPHHAAISDHGEAQAHDAQLQFHLPKGVSLVAAKEDFLSTGPYTVRLREPGPWPWADSILIASKVQARRLARLFKFIGGGPRGRTRLRR